MASAETGTALLGRGTTTITGWVVLGIDESRTSEEVVVMDEDNQAITFIDNWGERYDVSLDLIAKSGTSIPSTGDTLTYTSKSFGAGQKIHVTEVSCVEAYNDVVRCTVKGPRFAGITFV